MSKKNKSIKVGRRKKPTKADMRSNRVSREAEKRKQLQLHRRHQEYMRLALDNQITMQTTMDLDRMRLNMEYMNAHMDAKADAEPLPILVRPDAIIEDGTIIELKLAQDMPKPIIVAEESGRQLGKMLKLAEQTSTGGMRLNIKLSS